MQVGSLHGQILCNLDYVRYSWAAIRSNMSFLRYPYKNDYTIGPIAAEVTATHQATSASHYSGTAKGHMGLAEFGMHLYLLTGPAEREVGGHPAEPSPKEGRRKRGM